MLNHHSDIRAQNIVITCDYRVKLTGFNRATHIPNIFERAGYPTVPPNSMEWMPYDVIINVKYLIRALCYWQILNYDRLAAMAKLQMSIT